MSYSKADSGYLKKLFLLWRILWKDVMKTLCQSLRVCDPQGYIVLNCRAIAHSHAVAERY